MWYTRFCRKVRPGSDRDVLLFGAGKTPLPSLSPEEVIENNLPTFPRPAPTQPVKLRLQRRGLAIREGKGAGEDLSPLSGEYLIADKALVQQAFFTVATQFRRSPRVFAAPGGVYGPASFSADRESHSSRSGHNVGEPGPGHLRSYDHPGCESSRRLRFDQTAVVAQRAPRRSVSAGQFQRLCPRGPLQAEERRRFRHGGGVFFHRRPLEGGSPAFQQCRGGMKISLDINSLCGILAHVEKCVPAIRHCSGRFAF